MAPVSASMYGRVCMMHEKFFMYTINTQILPSINISHLCYLIWTPVAPLFLLCTVLPKIIERAKLIFGVTVVITVFIALVSLLYFLNLFSYSAIQPHVCNKSVQCSRSICFIFSLAPQNQPKQAISRYKIQNFRTALDSLIFGPRLPPPPEFEIAPAATAACCHYSVS